MIRLAEEKDLEYVLRITRKMICFGQSIVAVMC